MATTPADVYVDNQQSKRASPTIGDAVAMRLSWLTAAAALLGFCVAVFGAYVRLSDAGLSCPDWPGCYGQVLVPQAQDAVAVANAAYPDRPVDAYRAWLEMGHRYAASVLGLLILGFFALSLAFRSAPRVSPGLAAALLALVMFQGALGMWTVTMMLKPVIVTGHLLGGFTTVALLWWTTLRLRDRRAPVAAGTSAGPAAAPAPTRLPTFAVIALVVLYGQITLGAWTSTNYAALACPDFPTCQGQLVPKLALSDALHPWQGSAQTYEGGTLGNDARVTIHFLHRVGAIVASAVLLALGVALLRARDRGVRAAAVVLVAALALQVTLGISNIVLYLPIEVATGHNGGAALLLLVLVTVYHRLRPPNL